MLVEVRAPKLGSSVKKGLIVKWLKKEGALVQQGEAIAVLETEKITVEVEAPIAGIMQKRMVPAEQFFHLDTPIAMIHA